MSNLSPIIDDYATICAQIAELEKKKAKLKKELLFLEEGNHEGNLYTLTVSLSDRDTLDMKAVREKLSAQFIRAHTTTTPVVTFRTKARELVEA
jgi:hypothetical protein